MKRFFTKIRTYLLLTVGRKKRRCYPDPPQVQIPDSWLVAPVDKSWIVQVRRTVTSNYRHGPTPLGLHKAMRTAIFEAAGIAAPKQQVEVVKKPRAPRKAPIKRTTRTKTARA